MANGERTNWVFVQARVGKTSAKSSQVLDSQQFMVLSDGEMGIVELAMVEGTRRAPDGGTR